MPAAKTGRMPAARSACTSGWKDRSQPGPVPSDQEPLTTWGASAVAGSWSGSSTHWKAWWTAVAVAAPRSLKILAAIQLAPGAIPIEVPAGVAAHDHAHRGGAVAGQVGRGGGCSPYGSNQLLVPPRHRLGQVGVGPVDPAVQGGHHDALTGVARGPRRRAPTAA